MNSLLRSAGFLLTITLLPILTISAQDISLQYEYLAGVGDANGLIELPNYITNNSGGTAEIMWIRIDDTSPEAWDIQFCDKNLCYASFVDTGIFTLSNGETGILKPVVAPNGVEGNGVLKVRLQAINGIAYEDTAIFDASTEGWIGIENTQQNTIIQISPTVTAGILQISAGMSKPSYFELYGIDGIKQLCIQPIEWNSHTAAIDLATLPGGIYLLTFFDEGKNIIQSEKILKQ